jgi:predicted nucleic-acid-binding protein
VIAIDTNVLLRWLVDDDPRQSAKARSLFDASDEILVTDMVLAETVWVLAGRGYRLDATRIEAVVAGLLEDARIVFEDSVVVWSALQDYASAANRSVNFADCLIVQKARATAAGFDAAFQGIYTFDESMLGLDGVNSL